MRDRQWFVDKMGMTMTVYIPGNGIPMEMMNGGQVNLMLLMQELGYRFD